jgi:protein kinase C substrate 80K-H
MDLISIMVLIRYEYELYPFHQIIQRSIAKQENISLGNWDRWVGTTLGPRYTEMIYSGGDACWDGPARTTRVVFECGGPRTIIQSIEEPEKCAYMMRVETPLACWDRRRGSKNVPSRT